MNDGQRQAFTTTTITITITTTTAAAATIVPAVRLLLLILVLVLVLLLLILVLVLVLVLLLSLSLQIVLFSNAKLVQTSGRITEMRIGEPGHAVSIKCCVLEAELGAMVCMTLCTLVELAKQHQILTSLLRCLGVMRCPQRLQSVGRSEKTWSWRWASHSAVVGSWGCNQRQCWRSSQTGVSWLRYLFVLSVLSIL